MKRRWINVFDDEYFLLLFQEGVNDDMKMHRSKDTEWCSTHYKHLWASGGSTSDKFKTYQSHLKKVNMNNPIPAGQLPSDE